MSRISGYKLVSHIAKL